MPPAPLLRLIICDICETFFFGIYTVLFVFSTVFLLSKQGRTRTRNLVLSASIVMYIVSAAHWAINIALLVRAARNNSIGVVLTPTEELAASYLPAISGILGDAIVVWRAWVLWERRRDLIIPPVLFLLGTTATSAVSAALNFKIASSDTEKEAGANDRLWYSIYGLTILSNLWATSLICIRAWCPLLICMTYSPLTGELHLLGSRGVSYDRSWERAPREPEQRRRSRF